MNVGWRYFFLLKYSNWDKNRENSVNSTLKTSINGIMISFIRFESLVEVSEYFERVLNIFATDQCTGKMNNDTKMICVSFGVG